MPVAALFESLWGTSEQLRLDDTDADASTVAEARVREVVNLMALGHKDEVVARRMGISVRSVRRLVQAAMDGLQAQSRFQAGVNAVRQGWLGAERSRTPETPNPASSDPAVSVQNAID